MTTTNRQDHLPANDSPVADSPAAGTAPPPAIELSPLPAAKLLPAISFLLVVVTALAFWQVGRCGFINFDDGLYVNGNPHVLQGLTAGGIKWAFTAGHAANWHPLTWISHMIDVQLFGLRPGWHHVVTFSSTSPARCCSSSSFTV